MRILINDFGGYPFPIQLSRYLAVKGFTVVHTYISNIKTPHGNMTNLTNEIGNLKIVPIRLKKEFNKYSFIGRYKGELDFSNQMYQVIADFKPDILISANTPLMAQTRLQKQCKKENIKFIYWCQDIHSIAIQSFFEKRKFFFGKFLVKYFTNREIKLLKNSDHVIAISNEFNVIFKQWGISESAISVIQNWGPLAEITVQPKFNPWSEKHKIDSKIVVLYSGTLGLKHNPMLIAEASSRFKHNTDVVFVVISEGMGASLLQEQIAQKQLNNLIVLPYQDYNFLSQVLGSADILLSILEKDAALFSVPSKVLTYLCAKKPLLLSVPTTNLSAKIVLKANAGLCAEPDDFEGFFTKLSQLIDDQKLRITLSENGRRYAENNFEISSVSKSFLKVINNLIVDNA
ncbi:MAG: glycosyltransferase WbuB [Sphingobacteriaceae bacterium]|nr:MAG: glycosyltransferase WbuB [Sphingobacteriaceae bacterium]